jgi:hypothetical protein
MDAAQIQQKVIQVIAANSRFTEDRIKQLYQPPELDPGLDRFIPATKKTRLANKLKREMNCVKSTELTNLLYVTITTLGQLIKKVRSYCETPNI